MKLTFLEGKTPAERNKIIAAIVLGGVAVIALTYTLSGFLFPAKTSTIVKSTTPTPTPFTERRQETGGPVSSEYMSLVTTPVIYNPTTFSADAGRNIFAFYEPPPPTPYSPTPYVAPLPPPPPTPVPATVVLGYISPSSIYAGSKGFRLEVMGDKFTPDVRVIFHGSELQTNFINSQKLTADVPSVLISGEGQRQVTLRSPDGKWWSYPVMMQVQAPPVPNFEYIGLVEKKHRNNDMAILREKGKVESVGFRLNDTVGDRFRVVSISAREVILEDRSLGFRHRLTFSEGKASSGPSVLGPGFGRGGGQFPNIQPYPNIPNPTIIQPGENPAGIPANIKPYVPPNANSNRPQNQKKEKTYEDDDDDGPDRR